MTNWLLVSSPDNFEKNRDLDFRQAAMKSRHRRKWERVQEGDRVFLYLTGHKAIGAELRVTGVPFESHEKIWGSPNKPLEDYPFRFPTEPLLTLTPETAVPAEPLAREMAYTKRWPADNWTLAFQGNVHELSDEDAALIHGELERAAKANAPEGSAAAR